MGAPRTMPKPRVSLLCVMPAPSRNPRLAPRLHLRSDVMHDRLSEIPTGAARDGAGVSQALERVHETGQTLLVRRLELLISEVSLEARALIDEARTLFGSGMLAVAGILVALGGWIVTVAGILRWAEAMVPRFAAEISVGLLHCLVGAALAWRFLASRGERSR